MNGMWLGVDLQMDTKMILFKKDIELYDQNMLTILGSIFT